MLKECIIMSIAGLVMIIIGIFSISQNAFYLPWFTRSKVADEYLNKYANGMGAGSVFIGIGITGTAIARIFISGEKIWLIAAAGCTVGLIIIAISYFAYGKRH